MNIRDALEQTRRDLIAAGVISEDADINDIAVTNAVGLPPVVNAKHKPGRNGQTTVRRERTARRRAPKRPLPEGAVGGWAFVKEYEYQRADKSVAYTKERWQACDRDGNRLEKTFTFYHIENGKCVHTRGSEPIPYQLPELLDATAKGERGYVVDGERDADALRALGYCATTHDGGCGTPWTPEFCKYFTGPILLISDNSDSERANTRAHAEALLGIAADVKIIPQLPEVGEKGDCSDLIDKGWTREKFDALFETATAVEPPPIQDGAKLLTDLEIFVRRFVVVAKDGLLVIVLWVLHTYAIDAADATLYLNVRSPQKQCGKTRLLEVLALLVARPFFTARTSAAALIRKVAKDLCTLLLDESDTAFKGPQEYSEALRGILDAGNRRGGVATLCAGKDYEVVDFPVFGPKVIAGIGRLPDTVEDRCAAIELARRKRGETVEGFHPREISNAAKSLRERIAIWTKQNLDGLRTAKPLLPDELSDRAQDAYEPLFAIADQLGAGERARKAARVLAGAAPESEDVGERTLLECKRVFDERAVDALPTSEIVFELRKIEGGPFSEYRGRLFDGNALARRLKHYHIYPHDIRFEPGAVKETPGFEGGTRKGYYKSTPLDQAGRRRDEGTFEDAWERYAPPVPQQGQQGQHDEGNTVENPGGSVAGSDDVPATSAQPATDFEHGVAGVAGVAGYKEVTRKKEICGAFVGDEMLGPCERCGYTAFEHRGEQTDDDGVEYV